MQATIQREFEQLLEWAREKGSHTNLRDPNEHQVQGSQQLYQQLYTRASNLVGRSIGRDSDHYRELQRLAGEGRDYGGFGACLGIVEAALHDFNAGLLFDMKSLLSAELLGDFLEQAQTLLDAGYYVPAASLTGATLEDTLRKLCKKHSLPVAQKTKIGTLNADLARNKVYSALTNKSITAHADVRNNADHGRHDEFTRADVEEMLGWVKRFTEEQLR
jgi:hypothetical protein